jgi:cysteine desulfurase/selenocysteine lyase
VTTSIERVAGSRASSTFDAARVRADFPLLARTTRGVPLVYLDNAATSQKPRAVIDAVRRYYEHDNANIHRGVYALSAAATEAYEEARSKIARYLGAGSPREVVFVRGATEAINLVAATFGRMRVGRGDEVLVSAMEHHSNIVPWQLLCEEKGARLTVLPMTRSGELELDRLEELLTPRTRILAITHVSNSLGTVNPIREIVARAHARGVPVVVDGAQAVPHGPVDVTELDCDFYAVSGHKMFGPTGIGALYGKAEHLEAMPPYQGGGDMIRSVRFEKTTFADIPSKFEAGTPHIAGAVGLGAAVAYLVGLDWTAVADHEADLLTYATERLATVPGLTIVGTARQKVSVISFTLDDVHAHDIGSIVDQYGVAIRTGHHCTQPVMEFFGIPATARASFAFYNTRADADALIDALGHVRKVFA